MEKCNYVLPRYNISLTPENEIVECLLPHGHDGEHLSLLPNGTYLQWHTMPDWCHCEEEDCQCFEYRHVTKATAQKVLEESSAKTR